MGHASASLESRRPSRIPEGLGERFARLVRETSTPGWDGDRSQAIPLARWEMLREFARAAADGPGRPNGFPSPSPDGSVYLSYETPRGQLSLEFAPDGFYWCLTCGKDVV